MLAATVIGVPLGVAASRNISLKRWSLAFANVTQTIPSLALFGFLIPGNGNRR
jgi:osmoprotectant transport system permease protein